MGLFDSIKSVFGGGAQKVQEQVAQAAAVEELESDSLESEREPEHDADDEAFDLAGFDPDDEDAIFHAQLHMESEGEGGGTDESRAEIMARYGIRDRRHWQTVRDSTYHALARKHGSMDVVLQRQMNYRQGLVQKQLQNDLAGKAASGEMAPVEGVSLESWAAMNASLIQGANLDDLLKGAGIDKARWDRARAEWEARMARDTTFVIAQIYGNAFQNASKGRYGDLAREANTARAENRDLRLPPPMTLERYFEIMFEQAYAAKQGKNPIEALKACDLSVVDWTDLSSYMGYFFHRGAGLHAKEYSELCERIRKQFEAAHANVKVDVDIAF
jgi:hypothetical protein